VTGGGEPTPRAFAHAHGDLARQRDLLRRAVDVSISASPFARLNVHDAVTPKVSTPAVIIVGAGGHGRVVLDIVRAMHREVVGFLDDECKEREVNGTIVLGGCDKLASPTFVKNHDVVVAIGDNRTRRHFAEQVLRNCGRLVLAVHPACVVSATAEIGEGTVVVPGVVINANARIGRFCIVNTGATIGHDVVLEDGAQIAPGVNLGGGASCGEDSFIGIGAAVAPGVRIGAGAVLGAGATAVRDIDPGAIAFGTPAKARGRPTGQQPLARSPRA
jgi:acetyltransferase EpsM